MNTADPAVCPFEVERVVMLHRWERLTFLHWSFEPAAVQRLLPSGLTVETVGKQQLHAVPWASQFCETNVRTYVRDETGRSGIWFFSLDAARLGAVVTARTTYRLPYFWSEMALRETGSTIEYTCRRRWPGPVGARSHVVVDIGEPYKIEELTAFDHFLTARWVLFSRTAARYRFARAFHEPWPLHHAVARTCDDELIAAAGLPQPVDEPIVHYAPGVDVRIGRPER